MISPETTSLSTSLNFCHNRLHENISITYIPVVWCWKLGYTDVISVTTSHVSIIGPTHWNKCCYEMHILFHQWHMIYQSVSNRYSILLFNLWISTVKSNQAMFWATHQATNRATNRAMNQATNWATKPSDELSYKSSFKTCKSNCESSCELKLLHSRATVIIWVLLIMKALRAWGIYIYIYISL